VWLFHVSRNGRKAYLATSSGVGAPNLSSLYEFDLTTAATRPLRGLSALSPALSGFNVHTGYDAWDAEGRFYFSSFSTESEGDVVVTRLDPVRLKVALGVLPSLTEVNIDRAKTGAMPGFLFARSGATATTQKVLYKLVLKKTGSAAHEERGTVEIPAGAGSASIALQELSATAGDEPVHGTLSILPNGDDYTPGPRDELRF
jgi:hypothetical protein